MIIKKKLSSLLSNDALKKNEPMQIPVENISEDPHQPRKENNEGFSEKDLGGLAETIKLRGIKTPISVRLNPEQVGHYIINHGARRYRAAKIAGLKTIPALIDDDYNEIDQVVENVQRTDLSIEEIALFVKQQLEKGLKKQEIAKLLGKSNAYISRYVTFLNLPNPIREAFDKKNVQDILILCDLSNIYKAHPDEVIKLIQSEVTRSTLSSFKQYIQELETIGNDKTSTVKESNTDSSLSTQKSDTQASITDKKEPIEPKVVPSETGSKKIADNSSLTEDETSLKEINKQSDSTLYVYADILLDSDKSQRGLVNLKETVDGQASILVIDNHKLVEKQFPIESIIFRGIIKKGDFLKI